MSEQTTGLVPKLRFPEFREAGDWSAATLEDIAEIASGGTPNRSNPEYWNGNIPWVSTTLIDFNTIKQAHECITRHGLDNSSAKIFPQKTILMAMYGQGKTRGKVAVLGIDAAINQACAAISVNHGATAGFVFQNLAGRYDEIRNISNQGGQENLSASLIKKIPFSYPEIEEQQKIAACLSSLDALITAQADKLAALKTHKKGLMQQLFPREGETVPCLRFPEFREAGEWFPQTLKEFISERNQFPEEKIPLYSLTIEDGIAPKTERYERSFLVKNEAEAYKLVLPNDFAYNPMNLRFGAIARHVGTKPVAISKYYNIFHCNDSVDSRFCDFYFKSPRMISYYDDVAIGSLIEKRRVHFSDFLKFKILFPSLDEQQKIAACLSSLDALITAQADKLDALKTHKKGLMQQLFPRETREIPAPVHRDQEPNPLKGSVTFEKDILSPIGDTWDADR